MTATEGPGGLRHRAAKMREVSLRLVSRLRNQVGLTCIEMTMVETEAEMLAEALRADTSGDVEGLRTAAERMIAATIEMRRVVPYQPTDADHEWTAALTNLRAALAASTPPAPPELDVERLADAIYFSGVSIQDDETREWVGIKDSAQRIADLYAKPPDPTP